MRFEENLKNFRFANDEREIFPLCLKFADHLIKNDIKKIEIYLTDAFKFYVAFFGAMMADITPYVLAKPIFSGELTAINDENFLNFLGSDETKARLNLNSKFYLQTSGSSGANKMIEKSLAQMIKESEFLAGELKFDASHTFFSSVSHQHMFGLTFKVFLPLILGARVVAEELNYPEVILGLNLKNHVFVTSPVLLAVLVQNARASALKSLSGIISAGSALKDELREQLSQICDARIVEIYGSTETGVIARNEGDGLRLFSEVCAGLDEREALNVRSPWCEFFQTNDWASVQGERLTLKGRIDRIIKLNDKRVSLESIEAKLLKSGLLNDCYCGLHPNFKRIVALLVLNENGVKKFRKSGKKGVVSELKELLFEEFKNNVRHFKIVENLPRNAQGKFAKCNFEKVLFDTPKPQWSATHTGDNHIYTAHLHAGLEIFESHFPNLPLLPGFVQLDFVFELAKDAGIDVSGATSVENLKFMKFVRPNDELKICLEKCELKLYFEIFCNDEKCSSGRIKL